MSVTGNVKGIKFGGTENFEMWVTKADGTLKVISIKHGLAGNDTLFLE